MPKSSRSTKRRNEEPFFEESSLPQRNRAKRRKDSLEAPPVKAPIGKELIRKNEGYLQAPSAFSDLSTGQFAAHAHAELVKFFGGDSALASDLLDAFIRHGPKVPDILRCISKQSFEPEISWADASAAKHHHIARGIVLLILVWFFRHVAIVPGLKGLIPGVEEEIFLVATGLQLAIIKKRVSGILQRPYGKEGVAQFSQQRRQLTPFAMASSSTAHQLQDPAMLCSSSNLHDAPEQAASEPRFGAQNITSPLERNPYLHLLPGASRKWSQFSAPSPTHPILQPPQPTPTDPLRLLQIARTPPNATIQSQKISHIWEPQRPELAQGNLPPEFVPSAPEASHNQVTSGSQPVEFSYCQQDILNAQGIQHNWPSAQNDIVADCTPAAKYIDVMGHREGQSVIGQYMAQSLSSNQGPTLTSSHQPRHLSDSNNFSHSVPASMQPALRRSTTDEQETNESNGVNYVAYPFSFGQSYNEQISVAPRPVQQGDTMNCTIGIGTHFQDLNIPELLCQPHSLSSQSQQGDRPIVGQLSTASSSTSVSPNQLIVDPSQLASDAFRSHQDGALPHLQGQNAEDFHNFMTVGASSASHLPTFIQYDMDHQGMDTGSSSNSLPFGNIGPERYISFSPSMNGDLMENTVSVIPDHDGSTSIN